MAERRRFALLQNHLPEGLVEEIEREHGEGWKPVGGLALAGGMDGGFLYGVLLTRIEATEDQDEKGDPSA